MNFCRKYLQFFWMAVILLIAGGQLAHAYQEITCAKAHSEETSSSENCPTEHQCCTAHSNGIGLISNSALSDEMSSSAITYFDDDAAYSGGVLDEIEYPPRLS